LPKNKYVVLIILSIKNTYEGFNKAIKTVKKDKLIEDDYTQIFVKQNTLQLQKLNIQFIYAGVQYRDLHHKTKGIPDIHYSFNEENIENEPIFIIEAKRLPTPTKEREKEYVVGKTQNGNPNGGIERFKLEKHGKGLNECGIIGYVEKHDFDYWYTQINLWIQELSVIEKSKWSIDECLNKIEFNQNSTYCHSLVIRSNQNLKLHHFWIKIDPVAPISIKN
jgi:hypothetical protein